MKTGLSLAAALLMLGVVPLSAQEGPLQIYSAYPDEHIATAENAPLWRQKVVDRLKTPLTRYHE